jgi:hypothetical protein
VNAGGSGSSSSSGSGSSSKVSKIDKTKKSDIVERYKEVTDTLNDIARASDKASKAMDTLYGQKRFNNIKEQISLLKE